MSLVVTGIWHGNELWPWAKNVHRDADKCLTSVGATDQGNAVPAGSLAFSEYLARTIVTRNRQNANQS